VETLRTLTATETMVASLPL